MGNIDYKAIETADGAITIVYIISIILVNSALVITVVKKGQFLYRPRSLTLMSMAFADVFFALFPLVINAMTTFGDYTTVSSLSCSTLISSKVYQYWMIHFVYSTGLIVLTAEFVYRYRKNQRVEATNRNIIVSLLVSSLPWILGLIIVLPLSISGGGCYFPRFLASFGVCVLLPAIAAVIACGLVKFSTKLLPVQNNTPSVVHAGGAPNFVDTAQNSTPPTTQNVPSSYPSFTALQTAGAAGDQPQQGSTQIETQYETLDEVRYKVSVPTTVGIQQPNFYLPPSQNPGFPSQQHPDQPTVYNPAVQSSGNRTSSQPDPTREKNLLLTIAVINIFCVSSYAIFMMSISVSDYKLGDSGVVAMYCLSWFSMVRFLVTPAIFRQI